MQLLTTNAKLAKCEAYGYLAVGLELAPGKLAGRGEACPARGDCYKTCIFSSGFGSMTSVRKARIERHRFMFNTDGSPRADALLMLRDEIATNTVRAAKRKLKLAVRLNTFSDYEWERIAPHLFDMFPGVQFYDYTKRYDRAVEWSKWLLPKNYHLVFSCSEKCQIFSDAERELRHGVFGRKVSTTVAAYEDVKTKWVRHGMKQYGYVDGDLHDLTFLHKPGSIIVLSAKGKAGSRNPKANKFLVR